MRKIKILLIFLWLSPLAKGQILNLNDSNYYSTLNNATKLVIVDFYFDACAPCKVMKPIMDSIENENKSIVEIYKMDVFKTITYNELGINKFPTFLFYKNGKLIFSIDGKMSKGEMIKLIEKYK